MKERLTRPYDEYECRIKECTLEEWMKSLYGDYPDFEIDICNTCPVEKIANKLAEYEDKEERMEDDLK